MRLNSAPSLDLFRAAKNWLARYVGISGLGTNPTNPWCQHPRRPPLHCKTASAMQRSRDSGWKVTMTGARRAQEAVKLVSGGAGLFLGLSLLGRSPLVGVLAVLGGMSLTLTSAARLCGVEVRSTDVVERQQVPCKTAGSSYSDR